MTDYAAKARSRRLAALEVLGTRKRTAGASVEDLASRRAGLSSPLSFASSRAGAPNLFAA